MDRPIIFSGPMVRELLDGRKTQTRRLATSPLRRCEIGDQLYVRESYMPIPWMDDNHTNRWSLAYAATGSGNHVIDAPADFNPMLYNYERWIPSIHMPRWASRLALHVEDVRVERLQEISEADAKAEGAAKLAWDGEDYWFESDEAGTHRCGFAGLWKHLHGADAWDENPSVVAISFRVEHGNIDRLRALASQEEATS